MKSHKSNQFNLFTCLCIEILLTHTHTRTRTRTHTHICTNLSYRPLGISLSIIHLVLKLLSSHHEKRAYQKAYSSALLKSLFWSKTCLKNTVNLCSSINIASNIHIILFALCHFKYLHMSSNMNKSNYSIPIGQQGFHAGSCI